MKSSAPLLFLDTSVVIAAVFSRNGGSRAIFDLAREGWLQPVITKTGVLEAYKKIQRTYGQSELIVLQNLLTDFQSDIKPSPAPADLEKYNHLIDDQDDRHILAGAVNHKVEYLITLDKKHFFTEKLAKANLGFSICTPGMFLSEFREKSDTDRHSQ